MALAASQVRLLQLTQRSNDIKCKLTMLSMDKMSLADDMLKVSRKYQEALNTKTLKWTNNSGVDYVDISYSGLMRPGSLNGYSLNMLTDLDGRVVVDNKYKQYAAMISPDGAPGGDWETNRDSILPQLLNVGSQAFQDGMDAWDDMQAADAVLNKLENTKPDPKTYNFYKCSTESLIKKIGNVNGINLANYKTDTTEYSRDEAVNIMKNLISAMEDYFPSEVFSSAFDADKLKKTADGTPESDTVKYTLKTIVDELQAYLNRSPYNLTKMDTHGNTNITWCDKTDGSYETYQNEMDEWDRAHQEAVDAKSNASNIYDEIFSPEVRKEIEFYDALFSSIADKGWKEYSGVSDDDYLNQMLQNGMFTITSVNSNRVANSSGSGHYYENEYQTDLALNCSHIVQVSDSDTRDDALVKYEHEKSIINAKETRLDVKMKNLETEQSSIKQMMESINNIMQKNIENTFNIFS